MENGYYIRCSSRIMDRSREQNSPLSIDNQCSVIVSDCGCRPSFEVETFEDYQGKKNKDCETFPPHTSTH